MIGAIILTFKKRENIKKQSYIKQISSERTSSIKLEKLILIKELK